MPHQREMAVNTVKHQFVAHSVVETQLPRAPLPTTISSRNGLTRTSPSPRNRLRQTKAKSQSLSGSPTPLSPSSAGPTRREDLVWRNRCSRARAGPAAQRATGGARRTLVPSGFLSLRPVLAARRYRLGRRRRPPQSQGEHHAPPHRAPPEPQKKQ